MKLGCTIKNQRVKLRVWFVNARYDPWLSNLKVNPQPVRLFLQFLGYGRCDFGSFHSKE
jgi:hypothetical protein